MFLLLELGKELGLHSSMNMSHLKCEQLFKTILGYIPEYIGKQKKTLEQSEILRRDKFDSCLANHCNFMALKLFAICTA